MYINVIIYIYIYIYIIYLLLSLIFQICYFFLSGFSFKTFTIHKTAVEGGGYIYNSSLPLPLASQTPTHKPGDYYRELNSAHS